MDAIFPAGVWIFALKLGAKSLLVGAAILTLTWFMRRTSAATRHLCLTGAVVALPGVDHDMIPSVTGSLRDRATRSRRDWTRYAPQYLDGMEAWLRALSR